MTDIEIARKADIKNINEIAGSLGISGEDIELYGKYKAKISYKLLEKLSHKENGKLI